MKLECAQSISHDTVTETQLRAAFADDKGRGEYIILSRAEQIFIRSGGEDDGQYSLEYRDGGDDRHFSAGENFTKADVERAFVYYLSGDMRWKTEFPWARVEKKPWWKLW